MRYTLRITTCALALLLLTGSLSAQRRGGGLVPEVFARRIGLERAWFTQIQLDSGRAELEYLTPFVSHANAFTAYQVAWETGKLEFSELERDAFGEPKGPERALKEANAKIEELTEQGFDPKLITMVVPEISLYATTSRGMMHAIDGETGRTRWVVEVGNPEYPTLAPAVNEDYVAVVNGSTIYVFDRVTGKPAWDRRLSSAPGAGAALTDRQVFVPMINGKVDVFKLVGDDEEDELKRLFQTPTTHVSIGRCFVQPTATPLVCAWPTDRGFMYVASANKENMEFRTAAIDTIVAPVTYDEKRGLLLMASVDGYVYAVNERSGAVEWRFSAGVPIVSSPHIIGDDVYVVTEKGGLYKVGAESGLEQWWMPRVGNFLAASETRVYCTDRLGRLLVVDAKSGGRLAALPAVELDFLVTNHVTDRIYVGTHTGLLQCLHEPQLERPLVYVGPGTEQKETAQVKVGGGEEAAKPAAGAAPAKTDDPFATGGSSTPDPFKGSGASGGGTTPAADPFSDPFGGGGSSPPAGGSTEPADDPFANPFE